MNSESKWQFSTEGRMPIASSTDAQPEPRLRLPAFGDEITSLQTGISYRIGSPVDAGGFGTVFECVDSWGDRHVAKVLRPVGDETEMAGRAESEVVAGAIARSRHIVHVADAFVLDGTYYIISEGCEFSLHSMMCDPDFDRPFWFPMLVKSLLHGLHFMHTQRLVHCDVHQGNILIHKKPCMVTGNEHAAYDFKLGDFGQTRSIEAVEVRSTWNRGCIPPEVLNSAEFGPVDHRVDLYQAGLVFLRFLLDKNVEFDADDILSGRPRELAESLQHPSAEAISALLRRHVLARPPTALAAFKYFQNHMLLS
jgi:serine/threonine protein kinase